MLMLQPQGIALRQISILVSSMEVQYYGRPPVPSLRKSAVRSSDINHKLSSQCRLGYPGFKGFLKLGRFDPLLNPGSKSVGPRTEINNARGDLCPQNSMEPNDFHDEASDILEILFTEDQIDTTISQLGEAISKEYQGKDVVVIGVATGAFMFLADLVRKIKIPVKVDLIRAQSYNDLSTLSSGEVKLFGHFKIELKGKHVIVVEDILDTGRTLSQLISHITGFDPASISVCVLLDKPSRRVIPVNIPQDGKLYRGFECPDLFVVGYGLDFGEKYRSLPYIGVLKPHLYS